MANDLKSTLRKLTSELMGALKGNNVKDLAKKMWSANHLNSTECDTITNCTDNFTAVTKLLDYTYARGDACILGLASALRAIQMSSLADKLCPAAASSDCLTNRATDQRERIVNEGERGAMVHANNVYVHSQVLLPIYKTEKDDETTAEDLKSRLRKLIPDLMDGLKGSNVTDLAKKMWAANHLNGTECDAITNCTDNFTAVTILLDYTYARGDACIIGLASALRAIQMSPLAEKLCPTAASSDRMANPVLDTRVEAATRNINQHESTALVVTKNVQGTSRLPVCQPNNIDVNAANDLKSTLRKLTPELMSALKGNNVNDLAKKMWSANHLNDTECDAIANCTDNFTAVAKLLDYTYARGDACIIGLANALRAIQMSSLADTLCPGAAGQLVTEEIATSSTGNQRDHGAVTVSGDNIVPGALMVTEQLLSQSRNQHGVLAVQSAQPLISHGTSPQYAAVQLRMSMQHTHLEVQVLLHTDIAVLERWQKAWKEKEPSQPTMPAPKPVVVGFSIDQPIVARLTSTADGGATVYHLGFQETQPLRLPGFEKLNPSSWLFRLADEQHPSDKRFFSLHLHKAYPTFSSEICEKFLIQDFDGTCFLYQLGFTGNKRLAKRRVKEGALFARPAISGGVHTLKTMRDIVERAESVGAIFVRDRGMIGTGFCVGTTGYTYVMTCYHVYKPFEADLAAGNMKISFGDTCGNAPSCVLGPCVAEDKELDYAILELQGMNQTLKPISCCSIDFETLVQGEDAADPHLIVVGYCDEHRTVDIALDWHMPEKSDIDLIKDKAAACYMAYYISESNKFICEEFKQHYLESVGPKVIEQIMEYDNMLDVAENVLFYNVVRHKHGSSGSPVFVLKHGQGIKLVALHQCGFPRFYYAEKTKSVAQAAIPVEYTIEAGTRLSAIHADLGNKNIEVCQQIFDNETSPMEETD